MKRNIRISKLKAPFNTTYAYSKLKSSSLLLFCSRLWSCWVSQKHSSEKKSTVRRYSSFPFVPNSGSTRPCSSLYEEWSSGFVVSGTWTWGSSVKIRSEMFTCLNAFWESQPSPKAVRCRFAQKSWAGVLLSSVEILWLLSAETNSAKFLFRWGRYT